LLYPLLVDSKGRVKVKTNWYSTPLWPGLRVTAVVAPLTVEIMHDNKVAARHRAVTDAVTRSSIWNTIWMCWSGSRAP
jgi:hypothetical protein